MATHPTASVTSHPVAVAKCNDEGNFLCCMHKLMIQVWLQAYTFILLCLTSYHYRYVSMYIPYMQNI